MEVETEPILEDLFQNSEEEKIPHNSDNARKIKLINKNVIHQICSGQVIVTLGTAVKELLENSIDAGATCVEIKLTEFGSKVIEVSDNGSGIEEENFEDLALKHHTSKLSEFDDLKSIGTFGFRGEALSSLCALSQLTVITRNKGSKQAYKIEYDSNGLISCKSSCAREIGTTVILKNIFAPLAVRHKEFLKNIKREFQKLVNILYGYCLITSVRIICTNQLASGSLSKVINSPSSQNMSERIVTLFGSKQLKSLVDIKSVDLKSIGEDTLAEFGLHNAPLLDSSNYTIEGYISAPNSGRSSADQQFLFINSRPCTFTKLSRIINDVYHQFSSRNQAPFICLHIQTKQENVDVNVTPDKRTMFLQNEKILYAILKASLYSTLSAASQSFGGENSSSSGDIRDYFSSQDMSSSQASSHQSTSLTSSQMDLFDEEDTVYSGNSDRDLLMSESPLQNTQEMKESNSQDSGKRSPSEDYQMHQDFSDSPTVITRKISANAERKIPIARKKGNSLKGNFRNILQAFAYKGSNSSQEPETKRLKSTVPKPKFKVYDKPEGPCKEEESSEEEECENTSRYSSYELGSSQEDMDDLSGNEVIDNKQADDKEKVEEAGKDDVTEIMYDDELDLISSDEQLHLRNIQIKVDWSKMQENWAGTNTTNSKSESEKNYASHFHAKISTSENEKAEDELKRQLEKSMFSKMSILGQFNLGFIIAKLGNDLFIIDQHASDEKYNFEYLSKLDYLKAQKLISPIDLNLPLMSERFIIDNIEIFQRNGFDFEINQEEQKVKLISIPYSKTYEFGKSDIEELIFMLDDAPEITFCRPSKIRRMLESRSCRMSIMIGTSLNSKTMRDIVDHMGQMDQPWNCPHGRPTIRHLINIGILPNLEEPKFNH